MPTPPLLTIVGRKHAGKTTLLVRLAAALHAHGHRIMTIKHGSHTFNIDPATTDTWRHYHEGAAERVAMVSPDKFALVVRWSREATPESIAQTHMADADLVLCEGFKASAIPRIEIFRTAAHPRPLYDPASAAAVHYRAMVTDDPTFVSSTGLAIFRLDDEQWLESLAAFVEREFVARGSREGVH